jgi:predicted TIM-barrel fold metal-dependent hydrolase
MKMSRELMLFDANGRFGCPSTGVPVYPTINDLLVQLNRLGVTRSVVWNVESPTSNCPWSNRRLLDEIEKTPGAKNRLIPELTISPTMIYETGAIDELKKMMKTHGTRALRFTRGLTNFTLRQVEPIIEAVRSSKPVIFMHNGEADPVDVLAFAEKFPEVSLVLTEVSWGCAIYVYDLMRQRKNILIETSWLHTWDAIEMTVEEFGAKRVIFGLGEKSHNGASIAAIARAKISDKDRELITHGNLERLLGVKAVTSEICRPAVQNKYWARMLKGETMGEELIDAHVHFGPGGGYVLREHTMQGQIQQGLQAMNDLGIKTMIVSSMQALMSDPVRGNLEMEEAFKPHGGKFKGYFAFNPFYEKELLAKVDECFSRDIFVGFKILCDYWHTPVTDPRFNSMWEYANKHRLPILVHTWNGPYDSPALLTDIVKRYPEARFLLAHAGGGDSGRCESEVIAHDNENVYLEWCGTFCSSIPFEGTLAKVGANKVVFGTDGVCHSLVWELGRLLSLDVPEEMIRPILGENMRKILARRVR